MSSSGKAPGSTVAVVLTHSRPRLAQRSVEMLRDVEGFAPRNIILVVNGEGGLEDRDLEATFDTVRLAENLGPAGGFRAGIERALSRQDADWVYVCEDDIALLQLNRPLVANLVERVGALHSESMNDTAAVVAYGRSLDRRTGRTTPQDPGDSDFVETDCAAWGCTLLSRKALCDLGVLPDASLLFGYEDIDFFLHLRAAGGKVLIDGETARAAASQVSAPGRTNQFRGERPDDAAELAWRHYYAARNFFVLRRRYGRMQWTALHLLLSVRRWQLAGFERAVGKAILTGLIDGARARLGKNLVYSREVGELASQASGHHA